MTPHKCPVCNGTGLVSIPPGIAGDQDSFATSEPGPWQCRACKGAMVIWELDPVVAPFFYTVCDHAWVSDTWGTRCGKCGEHNNPPTSTITNGNQ